MDEKRITNINIERILPNRMQPRIVFDDENIDELANSINKHGIINPITVRRLGDKFEIIAGERRFKACKSLGLKEIPAIVIEADDKKTAELALIENIQRKELSPIEEGMSYEKILQIGDITQAELSKQLGKQQSTIANKIRLLKLDDEVKNALLNNKISERHARSLLKLYDKKDQKRMLNKIINERLTVRQADKEIAKIVEEKGEMIEMDKNINVPNNNLIIENKEETIKNPETTVNPSFVDVNKIEEKSEEIFKEKPPVNIEDLLKPNSTPGVNEVVPMSETKDNLKVEETSTEVSENQPTTHKFFNFFPPEEETEIKEEPKVEPNTTNLTSTISSPMNFNIDEIETVTQKEEPKKEEPKLETVEELPEMKIDQIEEPIEKTVVPSVEKIEVPKPTEEAKTVEEPKPIEEPKEPEFDFNNFNPIIHNDFAGEEINDDEVEFIEEDEEPTPTMPEEQGPRQMRDVIKIIRDCNDIIESYGYKIETEEFDLETMYQVIFKIYKN